MGLFNDSDDNTRQDEVVIDAPVENSSNETRLGKQVESNLVDDSESKSVSTDPDSDISLKDIHSQNETIIDLLEQLVDKGSKNKTGSRNSNRVTNRGSKSSNRVTDRKDSSNNESIGEGMNELL